MKYKTGFFWVFFYKKIYIDLQPGMIIMDPTDSITRQVGNRRIYIYFKIVYGYFL